MEQGILSGVRVGIAALVPIKLPHAVEGRLAFALIAGFADENLARHLQLQGHGVRGPQ
jgi:hypothetical protein